MKVGLIDVDGRQNFPNLALMKLSRHHKEAGDTVEWYNGLESYDRVYLSKVFTNTPDYNYVIHAPEIIRGGSGYDLTTKLPEEIDRIQPDYSLYPYIDKKTAYGFLTRGCIRRCRWCIVPKKEGTVRPYMDVDEIAIEGRRRLILLDNNILAAGSYAVEQLEKIAARGYRIDFNQAMDARLVDREWAKLLARCKWIRFIRFGCDTPAQIKDCRKAIDLLRAEGYSGEFFLYTIIIGDVAECVHRASVWRSEKKVSAFAQPYIDFNSRTQQIPQWQKDLAEWVNRKEYYRACDFEDFEPRHGFRCGWYLKNSKSL